MSWSPRAPRLIRGAADEPGDAIVLDERARAELTAAGPVASASDLVSAANARAREIVAIAEAEAGRIVAAARVAAAELVDDARIRAEAEGFRSGHDEAVAQASAFVDVLRRAADEGRTVRNQVVAEAPAVVARAVMFAVRRIVGEYYGEDPARTSLAVEDALRAASGQNVVAIRVHPELAEGVRSRLVDVAGYVLPDGAVELGGCLIDLDGGTIDAALDTRLSLMELALARAAGEAGQ